MNIPDGSTAAGAFRKDSPGIGPFQTGGRPAAEPGYQAAEPKSMSRSTSELDVIFALLVGLIMGVAGAAVVSDRAMTAGTPRREPGDTERLEAEMTPLIEHLRGYRKSRGRYPETLESIGEKASMTRFGPWEYYCHEAGQGCTLRVGDYGKNGFVLCWNSSNKLEIG